MLSDGYYLSLFAENLKYKQIHQQTMCNNHCINNNRGTKQQMAYLIHNGFVLIPSWHMAFGLFTIIGFPFALLV